MSYQNYSTTTPTTDLFTEEPLVYGNFWERLGATLLDGVILLIPNLIYTFLIGPGLGDVLSILTAWLYSAILESSEGQATVGKKALGLKVVGEDGQRISFGQATGRHFGKIISAIVLFIGFLMVLWDEKRQALHDKMANTYIVKK